MRILGVTFPSFKMKFDKDLGPEALYFAEFSKEVISKMTIARLLIVLNIIFDYQTFFSLRITLTLPG